MDEKEISEIFSSEEAWESFVGGAVLGGVSSAGKAAVQTKKGKDYSSGLTNEERAVVDRVYKDAVAEKEADGKNSHSVESLKSMMILLRN